MLLSAGLGNGGLERQLALLATSLPDSWERRVWALSDGPFQPYLENNGVAVTVRERMFRFDLSPAAYLWRELWAWQPDVVHSWHWTTTLAAGPACRLLRIPLVDGSIQTGAYKPALLSLDRLGMAFAQLVAANTHAGLRAWGVRPAKGRVVHNGFDQSRLYATSASKREHRAEFTVIMTARMDPVKHYDVVLEAARILSRNASGWHFVLVGDGSERLRLLHSVADLVASDVVEFPTPGMDVLDLVREADVGVLMTNPELAEEGLSNSIMEYMAMGLAVVCSDGGGNPELVVDGVTGFIVPAANAAALAEKLAYLRKHEDERLAMGTAGKARIREEFSCDLMVTKMLHVYAEAMAGRS
ncbi:MAG: glycosyltransferase [Thermoleophilia bacterium]